MEVSPTIQTFVQVFLIHVKALVKVIQSLKQSLAPAEVVRGAGRPTPSAGLPVLERQVHGKKRIIYDLTQGD